MKDSDLKTGKIYWCEIVDESSPSFGKQFKLQFTGIFFTNPEEKEEKYYLWQLKIFREA